MIIRAYPALNLGGTPSQETGISPPSCLLLENCLYKDFTCFKSGFSSCSKRLMVLAEFTIIERKERATEREGQNETKIKLYD